MATVIGGAGLGLFDTLGQSGIKLGGNNGLQINASSGNLVLHHQDQTLVSKGLDLSLARTYNSQGNQQDANGDNWRFSFEREIQVAGDVVKRITGDGHQAAFNVKGGRYESTAGAGAHDSLSRQGEEWVYQEGSTGVKEYYNAQDGRLLRAEDRFGNQTHYQYQDGRLTAIQSASGEQLRFVFNDAGQLSRVDSWTQDRTGNLTHSHSKVHYSYDAEGRLSSVKVDLSPQDKSISDGQVFTTTYSYQNEHSYLLKQISKSNGSVVTLDYQDVAGKPHLSRIDDNGVVTLLDYQPSRANGHQLKVTDAKGQQWYYQHDDQGRLVGTLSPVVMYHKETGYGLNTDEQLTGPIGTPHGTRYRYDEQDNLVAVIETGARDERVSEYRYDAMGNRTLKTEAGQWRERYEYDERNRLVATHINNAPAEEGHRYAIYEGLNLRFEVSEAGLVTEHEYDGFGQRQRSRVYTEVAFVAEERPEASALIRWAAEQDKAQTQLTEFTYQRGLVHTQTRYEQLDAQGNGQLTPRVDVVAASQGQPAGGVWLDGQRVGDAGHGVTLTRLDAQGRLVSSRTFNTHQHTERSHEFLSQLTELPQMMAAGERLYLSTQGEWHSEVIKAYLGQILQGEFQRELRVHLSSFGASNEAPLPLPSTLLLALESTGQDSPMTLLDEQVAQGGRVSHHSGGAEHTRLTYDAFGQLLSSDTLVGNLQTGELKPVSSATQVYDGLGRVISETNAQGVTTTTQYLDARRQVLVTQAGGATVTRMYSTAGQLVSEIQEAPEQPQRERQFVYNEAGQLVATQHPDGGERFQFYDTQGRLWVTVSETGAVTEYRRDPQGRVAVEAQYASAADTSGWLVAGKLTVTGESVLSGLPSTVKPRVTLSLFEDSRETYQKTVTLGEEGHLETTVQFDAQGRILSEHHDRGEVQYQYDVSGRKVLSRDEEGYVTQYLYNTQGQVTEVRRYRQPVGGHSDGILVPQTDYDRTQTVYDRHGRVRFHMDEKWVLTEYRYLEGGRDKKVYVHSGRFNTTQPLSSLVAEIQRGDVHHQVSDYRRVLIGQERRDGAGRLVSSTDPYGTETRYVYDDQTGLLRQTVTAANTSESRSEYRQYNGFGELNGKVTQTGQQDWQSLALSSLIDNKGTRSVFDVMGRKASQHHPATGTTTYQYDKAGRLTHTIDAKGQTHRKEYNTYGEVSRTLTDGVVTKAFQYDLMGRLSREVDGEGVQTTYLYQRDGLLSHKVRQHVAQTYASFGGRSGSQIARYVTQYQYDARGNVIHQSVAKDYRQGDRLLGGDTHDAVRSGLKYVSQWQRKYDHRGRVVSETNGEGVERVTEYVAGGRIKTVKLSGAVQERIELDALGRTLSVSNGANERTVYEYDEARQRVTVISPGGVRTVTEKNAHGETVSMTDGQGHQRRFDYNADGQVTRTTFLAHGEDQPHTLSTNEYDAQTGLLTFSTNAEGIRTEYRYDALGRQWKVIQDADGEKLQTTYAYNADGQRISENREGRVTTLRYDTQGRKIWTEQGGVATEFIYDLNGQVIKQVEGALAANGQVQQERVTEYDRDVTGQVLEKRVRSGEDWAGTASARSVSYRYNAAGQVTEKQTGQGGIARTVYDELGRVQFEINALNYVTAYEYDAANRKVKTTRYAKAIAPLTEWTADAVGQAVSGEGRVTRHQYDEAGRLAFDIDGLNYATGYEYDAAHRVIRTTRYANPVTDSDWLTASAGNRVSESVYDAQGRLRFTISEKGEVSERGYDPMGRVTHTIRYDQSVALADHSEAAVSAFKAKLAQEVQAGRVRSELSVFDALGRVRFELDGEGYLVEYHYNRHSEKSRKKEYVNNQALQAALEAVRRQDSTPDDGAAISLALSRLASPDTLSEQLTAQLDTLNQQQGRIEAMKQALATLASGIAHTHAENGVLGDQLSSATQRLNRLYQEASLEAARQSELAQEIASLQTDISDKEQSLVSEYEAALVQARSAVQSAQAALSEQPEDAVLKDALAQARAEEQSAQTRLSVLKAQIAAHPFTAVADTNLAYFEVSVSQVGAQNPTLHSGHEASDTQLEDVDALSTQAEQGIAEAEGKQGLAEQNVVANRATVEALRKELETLSAGMQAQFEALNEQRVAYDALQIALAEGQSQVEARQTALKTATQEWQTKAQMEAQARTLGEAAQASVTSWQSTVTQAQASVTVKSQRLTNVGSDLAVRKQALAQAQQDRSASQAALASARAQLGSAQGLTQSAESQLRNLINNPSNVFLSEKATIVLLEGYVFGGGGDFPPRVVEEFKNYAWWAGYGSSIRAIYKSFASKTTHSELAFREAGKEIYKLLSKNGPLLPALLNVNTAPTQLSNLRKYKEMVHLVYEHQRNQYQHMSANIPPQEWIEILQRYHPRYDSHMGSMKNVKYVRDTAHQLRAYLQTVLSHANTLVSAQNHHAELLASIARLESAVQRQDALVSEAERSVSQAEQSQQQAQQALDEANTALNQAKAGLATAQQAMDEAQASLSQATREREAVEVLLSEARVHLAQAKTDKARTESELLAARTTLNQASVQFGKAHQSLSHTAEALNTAHQQLSEAVTLHGQVNASLTQANSAQYQASSAIDRAQQQIHIARYAAWRQAKAEMASNDTDYEYDARGRLVTERSAIVSYADVQKGQAVTQFVGRLTTRHSYDSLGNVIRTTTADGTRLQATQSFTFDVQGHQVQAEGLAGSQVVYNAKGLATININAEGHRRDRVYDALGQLRFEVDELGNVTEHRYNAYGDKTEQRRYAKAYSVAREAGRSLSLSALTQFTQQGGDWRQVSEAYNARGERIAVTQSSSVDAHTLSERTEFNRFGESVSVSKHYDGQLKAQVKHLYSVTGHRLASLNEENYVTLYGYNGHGELAEEKVFSNRYRNEWTLSDVQAWAQTQNSSMIMHRTSYEYDQRGHRHQVVRHGELLSVHDGETVRSRRDDLITTTYHDYAGRLTMTVEEVGETDPTKHSTAANRMMQEYDALGRLVSTWGKARDYVVSGLAIAGQAERPERLSAHQRVDYLYDAQGNQVATLTEGRQSFQYFNAQGQLTGRENALGHYTKVETDQMNRVIRETTQVQVSEGLAYTHQRTTEYAYDATGRQTGTMVKVASGDVTESAQYNAFGEVTEKRHNEAVQETHQYDGLGRVSQANRKGVEVTYEYDWQGLVTQEVTGGERTVRRRYDRMGNLTREESTAFGGQTRVTTQGFDRFGNALSRVVNGQATRFVYDHNHQVIRVTAPAVRKVDASGVVSESSSVTLMYYDVQGNRIAVQDANGHWQKSYYDVSGQKLMDVNGTGGETHYYHDAQGNQVARVNSAGQGEMFDYDVQGQLLSRSRLSADRAYAELYVRYAYDQVGQRYLEEWQGESGYRAYTHYDAAGRVTETQGEGTHRRYEYNTLGQKTAEHWLEDGVIKATKRAAYSATGRLTRETWLNGQVIQHEYDAQGRLIRKHGGGLDQRFEYDRSGLLAKQTVGSKSEVYQYDLHGRETRRELREGNHRLISESEWDALGRLRSIKAAEASAFGQSLTASEVRYDYDAVGNRRKVVTVKGSDTQTRWYHYDGDNRMVGSHTRTQDVATTAIGGHDGSRVITYNELGQKVKEVRWANTSRKVYYRDGQSQSRQELVKTETLTGYDQNGHLNQVNEFEYAGSQRVKMQEMHQRNARMGHALEQDTSRYEYRYWTSNGQPGATSRAVQSRLKDEKTTYYYWDGQLTSQHIASRSARNQSLRGQYDIHMTYHYSGQLSEQRTTNRKERVVDTQAYAYQATDAFRKSTLSVGTTRTAWGRSYRNGVTQFHYNPAGHLNRVTSTKSDSERQVLTDFNGQIALQLSGGQLSAELSSRGNPLAHVSDRIDADLMDEKASTVGQQPGSYTVSANDTLARIAQKVYGDSRYWYLLADANGVSPNTPLTEGKRLVVPNQHTQTFNGAESFKPYNESEVLGNITPDPIAPPPPPKSCSPVAMIVMAVVAVVVTVYTAGAAAPAIAGMTGAAAGSATGMAAVGAAALAGGASVGMHVGVAMGAAAIGGAMGSAASQLVGKAMGVVDDFSWGQVALGGLAAAASAGVGRYLSGGNVAAGQAANEVPAQSARLMERFGDGLVRSTASYSSQYLGAKMLGEDASFSWTNFAASVVGNAASGEVKLSMGDNLPSDFVSGMVGASAVSVLRGESLRENAGRFALDAFGNALGNAALKAYENSANLEAGKAGLNIQQLDKLQQRATAYGMSLDDLLIARGQEARYGYLDDPSGLFDDGQNYTLAAELSEFQKNYVAVTSSFGYMYPAEYAMRLDGTTVSTETIQTMQGLAIAAGSAVGMRTLGRSEQLSDLGSTSNKELYLGERIFVGQEVNRLFGQAGAVINGKSIRTVPADVSVRFQGMGYLDPTTNTFKEAPLNQTLAVDHIYPVKEIMRLPRFSKLTTEQQVSIIHDRVDIGNFQPLPKTFNSSKGSKLNWATYRKQDLDSVYVQDLQKNQVDIKRSIQRQINEFYKENIGAE